MSDGYVKPGYWVRGYAVGDEGPPPKKRTRRIGYTPDNDVSERVGALPTAKQTGKGWQ